MLLSRGMNAKQSMSKFQIKQKGSSVRQIFVRRKRVQRPRRFFAWRERQSERAESLAWGWLAMQSLYRVTRQVD